MTGIVQDVNKGKINLIMHISNDFKKFFERYNIKNEINNILKSIGKEIHTDRFLDLSLEKNIEDYYFPCYENIFRFASANLKEVKYIILGMEPYPSYYIENNLIKPIATGRSFEVSNIVSWKQSTKQTSFNNIFKSLYYNVTRKISDISTIRDNILEVDDYDDIFPISISEKHIFREKLLNTTNSTIENKLLFATPKQWFDNMERRGVMWLNATLTVRANHPDSHTNYWKNFINELICYIIESNKNIKWLIFGNRARDRVLQFVDKKNMIITCHPASRVNNTFVKDNIFQYIK